MTQTPNSAQPQKPHSSDIWAAIDLGSNSFQLLIGHWQNGHWQELCRHKYVVQLAKDFSADRGITPAALERARQALAEIQSLFNHYSPKRRFAVATEILRRANNADAITTLVEKSLDISIAIISGKQEAEYGFYGVALFEPPAHENRAIIDLGGASTEFSLGNHYGLQDFISLKSGCVTLGNAELSAKPSATEIQDTIAALDDAIAPYLPRLQQWHWQHCYATDGGISQIADILGWPTTVERQHVDSGFRDLCSGKALFSLAPEALQPIFAAALIMLYRFCERLKIARISRSKGSILHGVILAHANQRIHEAGQ